MSKIYIDVPHGTRDPKEIKASEEKLFQVAKDLLGEELEMVTEEIPQITNDEFKKPVLETINKVAECDYYASVTWIDSYTYGGTEVERRLRMARQDFARQVSPEVLRLQEQPVFLICPDLKEKAHVSGEAVMHSEEDQKN